MDEEREIPIVRVRPGCGNSCQVLQEFIFPGEWYYEHISRLESRGPFQRPATKHWLCVGIGVIE